jgi:hypothetical protein
MTQGNPPRSLLRSTGAVVAGLIAVFVLSLGTDEALHLLGLYPPWAVRMSDALFGLATAYRIVYGVAGGYLVARLAPDAPMRHALLYGAVGVVMSAAGLLASVTHPELGPLWYPVALLLTALPCAWAGGRLYGRRPAGA